jgi:dipeptidase E
MNLLLISNSTNAGEEYLGWPRPFISDFAARHTIKKLLFIPYAGVNLTAAGIEASFDLYEERVASVFRTLGIEIYSIHRQNNPVAAVRNAPAIAVGGGNTFHLVKMMHETGIMAEIRETVLKGTPYMGWSAGANVACPTMRTTNDMPISEPPSFNCMGLVPFQINPHYLDANPAGHGGETREQRINEFLTVNRDIYVAGLREACLLEVEEGKIELKGSRPMRVFKFGSEPLEFNPGDDIDFLLS